jgi:hypothetical protein
MNIPTVLKLEIEDEQIHSETPQHDMVVRL